MTHSVITKRYPKVEVATIALKDFYEKQNMRIAEKVFITRHLKK
jgi:hypothetical protein